MTPVHRWIRAGLVALPVYAALTIWSSIHPQPDQKVDPEGWARFVSTPSYLISHLLGSIGGIILVIFGTFALGALLARTRAARLGLWAMVLAVLGQALLLVPAVISTVATPAIGRAYLAGIPGVMKIEFPAVLTAVFLLGLLVALVGNVLLGIAVTRSDVLPKFAGVLWAVAAVAFYLLGVVVGLVAANATLPTQPVSALLILASGAWIAWSAPTGNATDPDKARAVPVDPATAQG